MEKKEKPLERLTAKELREMAMGLPGLQGVHAMKKDELIAAIRIAKGIPEAEGKKEKPVFVKKEKVTFTRAELKKKVRDLRAKREEALQKQDWKAAMILKKKISRTKKLTRRVAAA